jgi:hypothetical protein
LVWGAAGRPPLRSRMRGATERRSRVARAKRVSRFSFLVRGAAGRPPLRSRMRGVVEATCISFALTADCRKEHARFSRDQCSIISVLLLFLTDPLCWAPFGER